MQSLKYFPLVNIFKLEKALLCTQSTLQKQVFPIAAFFHLSSLFFTQKISSIFSPLHMTNQSLLSIKNALEASNFFKEHSHTSIGMENSQEQNKNESK